MATLARTKSASPRLSKARRSARRLQKVRRRYPFILNKHYINRSVAAFSTIINATGKREKVRNGRFSQIASHIYKYKKTFKNEQRNRDDTAKKRVNTSGVGESNNYYEDIYNIYTSLQQHSLTTPIDSTH